MSYRENGGVMVTPEQYFQMCMEGARGLGFSDAQIARALVKYSAKPASKPSQIVLAEDSRVEHILQTLRSKLGINLDPANLPPIPQSLDVDSFKHLVLVANDIALLQLVEVQDINNYLNLGKVRDVVRVLKDKFYWLWMQNGILYKGRSVDRATKLFVEGERSATCKQGLFLNLYYPELLNDCFMDMSGSRYQNGRVPCLGRCDGGVVLGAGHSDIVYSGCGSASSGSIT